VDELGPDDAEQADAAGDIEDGPVGVDLAALPLDEQIAYVRWYSHTPAAHLLEIADEVVPMLDDLPFDDRRACAELVVSLRLESYVPAALAALADHADNEWVRELVAELAWVQDRVAVVDAFIRAELSVLAALPVPLQRRWLWLAARRGPQLLGPVSRSLSGSPALDGTVVEADLGMPVDAVRRADFVRSIAGQARMTEVRARACVEVLADRMTAGARFRSQVVPWFTFDTYDRPQVSGVVDDALAAADGGYGYAAIRLGDGEAQVLAGVMPDITGVLGVAPDKEWNELGDEEYARLRARLMDAIRDADFVGVPDLAQCLAGPVGYSEVTATCLEGGVLPERIVPGGCDLGWALELSGEVDRLIARCTGIIGPIDPRDLRRIPRGADITWLPVPGELLFYYDEGGVETSHWSRFEAIVGHDFRPGQVWLVGAGVLAKIYCHMIRRAGAVAVDIGSVIDAWAGRSDTRGTVREQLWVATPYVTDLREPRTVA
jgi:hypothetical protein